MTNRTDFETLADELQEQFNLSRTARKRVATELHNAFIAGQEDVDRELDELAEALRRLRDFGARAWPETDDILAKLDAARGQTAPVGPEAPNCSRCGCPRVGHQFREVERGCEMAQLRDIHERTVAALRSYVNGGKYEDAIAFLHEHDAAAGRK